MPRRKDSFFEDVFEESFGPVERSALAFIYRGEGVTNRQIAKLLYGAYTAETQLRVRVLISNLRKGLKNTGWTIPVFDPRIGKPVKYTIERERRAQTP